MRVFRNILRKRQLDSELDEEIRSFVELSADEKVRSGLTRDDAFRQAQRELEGFEQVKENVRDIRAGVSLDRLMQDVHYGLRVLRRNPGFAAVAIATLALGIGATTAIFSLVDTVMFKPLPFPTADRLVAVQSLLLGRSGYGGVASYPDFLDWRVRNDAFDGMAVFRSNDFTLIRANGAVHLEGAAVSAQLFSLLGVRPVLGRGFLPNEDSPSAVNGTDPVVFSDGLWRRDFGGDPSVLGRTIQLNGQAFTIVGIMPPAFQFPIQVDPIELWTTIAIDAAGGVNAMIHQRGVHYLDVIALLKPGIKVQRAQAQMSAIARSLNREHPENKPRTVRVVPAIEAMVGPVRTPLLVLLGAVGCVLLIVCVNVANLLLARGARRRREMAVRAALGASRGRAMRQLLTESLTLSLLGGCLGLLLAIAMARLLAHLMPPQIPRLSDIAIDGSLLLFAFASSVFSGILFGVLPALQVSKICLTESLKERWSSSGIGSNRLRTIFVMGEVALSAILLFSAGLLVQSFLALTRVNAGFDPHHVLTFALDAPSSQNGLAPPAFFREVIAHVSAIPSVESASAAAALPLTGDNISSGVEIEGQPVAIGSRPIIDVNAVEPNYFKTSGITLFEGRDFNMHDTAKSIPVAIVNRTFARRFFPHQDPIGKRILTGISNGYAPGPPPLRQIVGVIGDVKQSELSAEAAPEAYAPLAQCPFQTMFIELRTANSAQGIIDAVRRQIAAVDKNAPLYHVQTMDETLARSLLLPRLLSLLLSGFAALALLLACLGVYGVVAYVTEQRTHEIGIRMALGAARGSVLRMIVSEGLRPALVGIGIGLAVSVKLTHVLSSVLYGVTPTDPVTFLAVALMLLAVALLASFLPSRRAANLDPTLALRYE